MLEKIPAVAFLLALVPAQAAAQSFNIDMGAASSAPSSSYGAAAQQPGPWNVMWLSPTDENSADAGNLVDIDGNVTGVSIHAYAGSGLAGADIGMYGIPGEVGRLIEDGIGGATSYLEVHFRVQGLVPGAYEVWTYAGPGTTILVEGAVEPGLQAVYQAWQGYPVQGQHYVIHHVTVGTQLHIEATWPGWREVLGLQLIRLDGASAHATCLGDGSASACPCGNTGGVGRGCATSFGPGARLDASGISNVANDTLVLSVDGVSNSTVTFFQGTQASVAGAGVPFGDGLRCAAGSVLRLSSKMASSNAASYPQAGDVPVSVRGAIPAFGGTRIYQVWYRNADPTFCTSATYNWSSGLAASWSP